MEIDEVAELVAHATQSADAAQNISHSIPPEKRIFVLVAIILSKAPSVVRSAGPVAAVGRSPAWAAAGSEGRFFFLRLLTATRYFRVAAPSKPARERG